MCAAELFVDAFERGSEARRLNGEGLGCEVMSRVGGKGRDAEGGRGGMEGGVREREAAVNKRTSATFFFLPRLFYTKVQ
jgi:hypothetical protein